MVGRSQVHFQREQGVDASGRRKPKCTVLPTIAGTLTVGSTLTGTNGTWTGGGTIVITRQWTRNGVPIANATGATYVLVAGDSGKQIRFQNIARSEIGVQQVAESTASTIA